MGVEPSDPICRICSKPIPSGSLVLLEHGELFHLRCRSQTLGLAAMEEVERAQAYRRQATRLSEQARQRQEIRQDAKRIVEYTRSQRAARTRKDRHTGHCPLCGDPATVTDRQPALEWVVVEGCPCQGFFILAGLVRERLASLSLADRNDLVLRVRKFRSMGHEAWCTTSDGTAQGPLVVRTNRPGRLT